MIKKLLLYVRQQPKSVRNHYALFVASAFTALVALVYVITGAKSDSQVAAVAKTESKLPFSTLINQAKDQWSAVRGELTSTSTTDINTSSAADTESDPLDLTLSPETIQNAGQTDRFDSGTFSSSSATSSETNYIEVQIATTSSKNVTSSAITP